MQAYELWQRGNALHEVFTKDSNALARAFFIEAIRLDNNFARAYGHLAYTYVRSYMYGWDPKQSVVEQQKALQLAQEALRLDVEDYDNHWSFALALLWNNQHSAAVAAHDDALRRNPSYPDSYPDLLASKSDALVADGKANQAVDQVKRAITLNPRHPPWYEWNLGLAYFVLGNYDDAIHCLLPVVGQLNAARIHLAASYALRNHPSILALGDGDPGDLVRAQEEITRLKEIEQNWMLDVALRQPLQPDDRAKLKAALQTAGLT